MISMRAFAHREVYYLPATNILPMHPKGNRYLHGVIYIGKGLLLLSIMLYY